MRPQQVCNAGVGKQLLRNMSAMLSNHSFESSILAELASQTLGKLRSIFLPGSLIITHS